MTVTKRIAVFALAFAGFAGPAAVASAGQTPTTAYVTAVKQNGPHVTFQDCEMWKTEYYMRGYRVWNCEQHPVSGMWWFLYE